MTFELPDSVERELRDLAEVRSRQVPELVEEAVLDTFQEAGTALKRYQAMHRRSPQRELYVVHTDREALDIAEVDWLGIRTA